MTWKLSQQIYEVEKITSYKKLGRALLLSLHHHGWYLPEELVVLGLVDEDVETRVKQDMQEALLEDDNEAPESFRKGKPELPVISPYTQLSELIRPNS